MIRSYLEHTSAEWMVNSGSTMNIVSPFRGNHLLRGGMNSNTNTHLPCTRILFGKSMYNKVNLDKTLMRPYRVMLLVLAFISTEDTTNY